ncbi:MAG: hypothetical protein ACYCZN_16335 [Candidatus Dormibacteria bacterium]
MEETKTSPYARRYPEELNYHHIRVRQLSIDDGCSRAATTEDGALLHKDLLSEQPMRAPY